MVSDSAIHSLAGAAGGIVAMSATYPLIVLSTRAAVGLKNDSKSVAQNILEILKREGVAGLYSGLSPSLLGIAITNGVYYYFYESSRVVILNSRQGSKALSMLESMSAGVIAGSITTVVSNPFWVVQTSQAIRTGELSSKLSNSHMAQKRPSALETIRRIFAEDGPNGFFRGLGPALMLVVNPVLQYTVFEQLKNYLTKTRTAKINTRRSASGSAVLSDWDFFVLGALSKLAATVTTYPCIVLKSRLQAGLPGAERYKSTLNSLLTILKEEGVRGLYKGAGSKLLQSVLTAAILFACQRRIYELTKKSVRFLGEQSLK